MSRIISIALFSFLLIAGSCTKQTPSDSKKLKAVRDSISWSKKLLSLDVNIEKDLKYDQYTLEDVYPYKDTTRVFKWDIIKRDLRLLDSIQLRKAKWGILQNYKNNNGEAPLVKQYERNAYKRVADTLGVERYQSVPLYAVNDTVTPEIYGRDGSLVKLSDEQEGTKFRRIETVYTNGKWSVPKKYIKGIEDSIQFTKAVFVDRIDQNIVTLEKVNDKWLVRSMNPATTGLHNPPHQMETPLGMFVIQEKKAKMYFLVDGTQRTGGFAPWASRFTNGGYLHGVPVNAPRTTLIEYSASLGTTPRSHMCVRNATSHAKFIYDWTKTHDTIVFVIE